MKVKILLIVCVLMIAFATIGADIIGPPVSLKPTATQSWSVPTQTPAKGEKPFAQPTPTPSICFRFCE